MPKDNNSNNIDNSGNLITFFFVNPLIDNSGTNLNLNIIDNSMSIIPINNSNKNNNLDFSHLEEWRRKGDNYRIAEMEIMKIILTKTEKDIEVPLQVILI